MPSILGLRHNRREFKGVAKLSHEEFDPLRVRPYVQLPDPVPDPADDVVGAAYTTLPIPAVRAEEPAAEPAGQPGARAPSSSQRRRRPFAVFAGGAGVVAVLGAAAFAAGLFSADDSAQDRALPDTASTAPDEPLPSPVMPSASATPSATPSTARPSPSASPSVHPSTPHPSATATASAVSSPSPSITARVTAEVSEPSSPAPAHGVLRRGDSGPGVVNLQQRMNQVYVYRGPADGLFDQDVEEAVGRYQSWMGIQDDPPGVYGPATRRALEAATQQSR
ncbi:peptidoglycan-binding protein [Streptomyces sp. NPDC051320]|uniref:peptidoglycan-binding domain-containing protein n=1 Tax=Streptomyces sp. NPDC051320 TaxID=3154644 RepID=UPI0034421FD8